MRWIFFWQMKYVVSCKVRKSWEIFVALHSAPCGITSAETQQNILKSYYPLTTKKKKKVLCDSRKFAFVCQGNQSENNVHKKETKNKDMKSFFIFPHHLWKPIFSYDALQKIRPINILNLKIYLLIFTQYLVT